MTRSDQPTAATADTFPAWFVQDIHWSRTGIPLAVTLLLLAPFVRRAVGRAAHGRGIAASILLHLLTIALIMRNRQRP